MLPSSARELIPSGTALAHTTTSNPDGSPQMSTVRAGLDGDRITTGPPPGYVITTTVRRVAGVGPGMDA